MKARVGTTLRSTVDESTFVVVRWGAGDLPLTCGGLPLTESAAGSADRAEPQPGHVTGTQLGKRYCTEDGGVELLCTAAGEGTLAVAGVPLAPKTAKPLPSSD